MNYYRHGDLGITPIKKIPKGIEKIYKGRKFTLAEGEATGHHHVLTATPKTKFEILKDNEGNLILHLEKTAKLTHQEHKEITIEPGLYIMKIEQEFDYFEKRATQVID